MATLAKAIDTEIIDYLMGLNVEAKQTVLNVVKALAKSTETSIEFTDTQIKELNKRRKAHLSGKSKSYTFEQIRKQAIAGLKK
jgi:ABC-type branched-subunit amino acid transport system ATPase component